MKINKSNFGWLFACIGLLLLLAVSIYLGVSGFYFKNNNSYVNDLILGQSLEGSLEKNQASSISVNFSGGFVPNEKLAQIVNVKNNDDSSDLYVRAKVYVFDSLNNIENIDVVENSNWFKNDDGYYYYNDLLTPQQKVNFSSFVSMGNNFVSWKKYILTFVFETLDSQNDVELMWGYNPTKNV